MTLEQIRKMLLSRQLAPSKQDIFAKGQMTNCKKSEVDYSVHCGWDIVKALACDSEWGRFNVKLLAYIDENYVDEALKNEMLARSSLEDHHWDWFGKAANYKSNEYRWFFLYAEGLPQAACLVYYPKKSVLCEGNIFYIEYLAVAPWNRRNVISEKIFSGVGTLLLKHTVDYCRNNLNLVPGFSLHALPGAMTYYEKIGMLRRESMDKGPLAYYEMPGATFSAFVS